MTLNSILFNSAVEAVTKSANAAMMPPAPGGAAAPPSAPPAGGMGDADGDPYASLMPLIEHVVQRALSSSGGGAGGAGGGGGGKGKAKIEPEVIMQMIQLLDQKLTTQNHLLAKIAETMGINFTPGEAVGMAHPGTDEAETAGGQVEQAAGGGVPPAQQAGDPAAAAAPQPQDPMQQKIGHHAEAIKYLLDVQVSAV